VEQVVGTLETMAHCMLPADEIKKLQELRLKITRNLESVLGISVNVKLVEPKTIERTAGKAVRVIDNRKI
jgi:phenylacetate-CoA ligase